MRLNRLRVFCDNCCGDVVNYSKDDFALNVYSSRDFIIKVKEPKYVCSKCGKVFEELSGLYKEEI